jgi:hypothetical protein
MLAMSERCPMTDPNRWPNIYYGSDIPDVCRDQCAEIWDEVKYSELLADSECSPKCEMAGTESSGDALTASSQYDREYITFDQCVECYGNAGGTLYRFQCPYV